MPQALYQPFPMPGTARGHVWHHVPETRRPRHFHSEPELNLIAAGHASFGFGDSAIAVVAGDLLWWAPGQDHVLLDASADLDLYVIGVTPELSARALATDIRSAYAGATRLRLDAETFDRLRGVCAMPLVTEDSPATEGRVGDLWRAAHAARTNAPGKHALTRRALVSMLENPELTRRELAAAARGYPTEVSRHFHRDMHLTLSEYRTRLRLVRFIQEMDAGAPNMLTAALAAGFGSYSQCHRKFQQTLGCSPRRFFVPTERRRMEDAFTP
jgi:AraC-like DNA-binding protein